MMVVTLINAQMSKKHINSFKALNVHFNKFIPGKSKIEVQTYVQNPREHFLNPFLEHEFGMMAREHSGPTENSVTVKVMSHSFVTC